MTEVDADWLEFAKIGRPHGLRGECRMFLHHPDTELLGALDVVQLRLTDGTVEQRAIRALRPTSKCLLVTLDGVRFKDQADRLTHATLWIPRELVPEPGEGEFYAFQLEGMAAIDATGEKVGVVKTLTEFGAGDILVVASSRHGDIMVPFADPHVGEVDEKKRTVVVDLTDFI